MSTVYCDIQFARSVRSTKILLNIIIVEQHSTHEKWFHITKVPVGAEFAWIVKNLVGTKIDDRIYIGDLIIHCDEENDRVRIYNRGSDYGSDICSVGGSYRFMKYFHKHINKTIHSASYKLVA